MYNRPANDEKYAKFVFVSFAVIPGERRRIPNVRKIGYAWWRANGSTGIYKTLA
jgi:hypothetical protein